MILQYVIALFKILGIQKALIVASISSSILVPVLGPSKWHPQVLSYGWADARGRPGGRPGKFGGVPFNQ